MNPLLTRTVVAALAVLLTGAGSARTSSRVSTPSFADAGPQWNQRTPEPPRATMETALPRQTGRTITVPATGKLQAALDSAMPGDRIELEPGATYRGPFRLPRKKGDQWIVIASAAAGGRVLSEGRRVGPSDAALMPRLVASTDVVVSTEPGAHHYRFVGVEIAPSDGASVTALVQLGNDETTLEALPHHIIFDRCYLHGDPTIRTRRGIAMNSRDTAVVDSYLSDFKELRADSQAIASWNGAGPFKITNNYLEAAGENVLFGGADPTVPGLVPADIEVVHNHFAKPRRWMMGHRDFGGVAWAVKNLFELKNARRVRIDGNLFEYNWPHAQNGFAILFTVRNQDGGAPWSTVEDVTFVNNLVRHVGAGINVLGRDDIHPSEQVRRIAIRNNVFLDIGGQWGNGRLFQLLDGTADVSIDHNTALQSGSILFGGDHAPHTGFAFQNNIALHNEHGITGSGTGVGIDSLTKYFPMALVRGNVLVGAPGGKYPAGNFFPPSLDAVGLTGAPDDVLHLTPASPYLRAGTDGRDPGADVAAITAALSDVASVTVAAAPASAATLAVHTFDTWPSERVAPWAFWAPLLLLGYIYFGYPLVAGLRARFHPKARYRAAIEPFVTVIVVVHNEADRIVARIENLLAQDYPRHRLEIIVGSDGSNDETVARARRYEQFGVVVRAFTERRGKAAVINTLVAAARGKVVVFADARQSFAPDAVRALVANFADAATGAVSGELILTANRRAAAAGQGTAFYWRYEKLIRKTESRSGSTVGATGAIYAIRRELFEPLPDDTILDDVLIPMRIIRRGYRVVFEPNARAYDAEGATASGEFARKTRTIAGTFQLFSRELWLFNPLSNPLWFETISHKALRLSIPALQVGMLAANIAAADVWPYQWALAGQMVFYGAALVGWTQRHARRRFIVLTVPYTMCLLGWATTVGFIRFLTHHQQVTWERVPAQHVPSGRLGRAA